MENFLVIFTQKNLSEFLAKQQAKSNKQLAKSNEQQAKINEQRVKNKEQRTKSNEQRAKSNEQQAKINEQRAKSNEQRAKSKEQRAKSNEQQATSEKFHLKHGKRWKNYILCNFIYFIGGTVKLHVDDIVLSFMPKKMKEKFLIKSQRSCWVKKM